MDYRATAVTVSVGVFVHGVQNSELVHSTTQRFVAPSAEGLPFLEISEMSPRFSK